MRLYINISFFRAPRVQPPSEPAAVPLPVFVIISLAARHGNETYLMGGQQVQVPGAG